MSDIIIALVKVLIIFGAVLSLVPVLIWMERKGAAYIQDRRGPNRANVFGIRLFGLIHSVADAIKLFTKEEIAASSAEKPLFYIAPVIALLAAVMTIAVVPFFENINLFGLNLTGQIADFDAGLVYVFAVSSIGVYALLIAGWSASGKYPFLGALRATAQMISYEVALGLSCVAIFLVSGSLNLYDIVTDQGALLWNWNFVRQPLAFILFTVALFAETNRLPFDLPEGESEIVAGYHTEYSSMRFALFFMGEYTHIIIGSFVITALFFGGWHIPFIDSDFITSNTDYIIIVVWPVLAVFAALFGLAIISGFKRRYNDLRDYEPVFIGLLIAVVGLAALSVWGWLFVTSLFSAVPSWAGPIIVLALQIACVFAKAIAFSAFFIWVRWTLPRFRYDQLMKLGWKVMLPLGAANVILTAAVKLL